LNEGIVTIRNLYDETENGNIVSGYNSIESSSAANH